MLSFLITWATIVSAVIALFALAQRTSTVKTKRFISRLLFKPYQQLKIYELTDTFVGLFDSLLGEKHLSFKCFLRSSVASLLSVVFVTIIFYNKRGNFNTEDLTHIAFLMLILNIGPDYLSLLETRKVLKWAKMNPKLINIILLLVLDFILTLTIAIAQQVICILYIIEPGGSGMITTSEVISFIVNTAINLDFYVGYDLFNEATLPSPGIFFYSTFFTSIWLWIFLFVVLFTIITKSKRHFMKIIGIILNTEKRPIDALGLLSVFIISLFLLSFYLINYSNFLTYL